MGSLSARQPAGKQLALALPPSPFKSVPDLRADASLLGASARAVPAEAERRFLPRRRKSILTRWREREGCPQPRAASDAIHSTERHRPDTGGPNESLACRQERPHSQGWGRTEPSDFSRPRPCTPWPRTRGLAPVASHARGLAPVASHAVASHPCLCVLAFGAQAQFQGPGRQACSAWQLPLTLRRVPGPSPPHTATPRGKPRGPKAPHLPGRPSAVFGTHFQSVLDSPVVPFALS